MNGERGSRLARQPAWVWYLAAPALVVAGAELDFLLGAAAATSVVFLLLYPAVLVCAWYGGAGPGLLALGAGALAGAWIVEPAVFAFGGERGAAGLLRLVTFLVLGGLLVRLVVLGTRRAQQLAESRAALEDASRRLRLFTDSIPVLLSYIDSDLRYRFVNRAYEEWFGEPRERVVGRPMREVLGEQAFERLRPFVDRALAGESVAFESDVAYRSGGQRRVSAVYHPHGAPGRVEGFFVVVTDVTRLHRLEGELASSERRLRHAVQATGAGVYDHDFIADRLVWSASFRAQLGVAADAEAGTALLYALMPPEDAAAVRGTLVPRLENGDETPFEFTFRIRRPDDGRLRWIWCSGEIHFDGPPGARRPVRGGGLTFDVTEEREAQLALAASESRLRAAQAMARLAAWEFESDGRGLVAGPEWYAMHGFARRSGIPSRADWEAVLHPVDRERVLALIAAGIGRDGRVDVEYRVRLPEAGERWLHVVGDPEPGDGRRMVGVTMDVTRLRLADVALRESEARFRGITEAVPQIVFRADRLGRPEYVNERWREYTGLDDASAESQLGAIHPDDYPTLRSAWQAALATGTPMSVECRLRRHDGAWRWFLSRSIPLHDAAGAVSGWIGTTTDIDDQKRAQQELREADRRKDEFIATLAHELRNPLAPIRYAARLLRAGADGAAAAQALGVMERQLAQMARLLDDLLDVGRVSRGTLELRLATVDLREVVEAALETARPLLDARGHALELRVPAEPLRVRGDAARLAQVVGNLLNNAAKYTQPGGHVAVEVVRNGDTFLVQVRDDGIGIEPALLPRVFELFVQAGVQAGSDAHAAGGLGIGLALSRQIATLHGGTLEAASAGRGRGSAFTLRLPAAAAAENATDRASPGTADVAAASPTAAATRAAATAPPAATTAAAALDASPAPAATPLRVLVVDDNVDAADALGEWLRQAGHQVEIAHDGEVGLAIAARQRPDVVLLDLGLPRTSGLEVARQLRETDWGRTTRLVAVTGWGQPRDRQRTREAGFDEHLVKPVDPDELERVLAALRAPAAVTIA